MAEDESVLIEEVVPEEALELVDAGAFLLDVREPDEWLAGRAPKAHHIPLGQLGDRVSEVPEDETVVVVCRSGGRSGRATAALVQAGYRALNLQGGMEAWARSGLSVVTDDGSSGTVI